MFRSPATTPHPLTDRYLPAYEEVTMHAESSAADTATASRSLEGGAVLYRTAEGAAEILLNRPEVLNAINGPVHRGIREGLELAAGYEDVRAVVIRGSGRAFCAGGDLKST